MNVSAPKAVGHGQMANSRPANFGQLNSAVARGDLSAAQVAFVVLTESSSPSAMSAKARGSLEAVGQAIASGDLGAAKASLADFRSGRVMESGSLTPIEDLTTTTNESLSAVPATAEQISTSVLSSISSGPSMDEQVVAMLSGSGSTIEIMA